MAAGKLPHAEKPKAIPPPPPRTPDHGHSLQARARFCGPRPLESRRQTQLLHSPRPASRARRKRTRPPRRDRKSTRLNSSHGYISYAVFCLKKKKKKDTSHYYVHMIHKVCYL